LPLSTSLMKELHRENWFLGSTTVLDRRFKTESLVENEGWFILVATASKRPQEKVRRKARGHRHDRDLSHSL
jgi:hypothetical protein